MTDAQFDIWPDCVEWQGSRDRRGYGKLMRKHDGHTYYLAHRYFYAVERGPIPEGMVLDHLCRNHSCINTDHLEPVSQQENVLRGVGIGAKYAKRDSCSSGHPYGDAPPMRSDGGRRCLDCEREIEEQRKLRRHATV